MSSANQNPAKPVKTRIFSRLLPSVSEATAETLDIIMDVEQVSDLLSSLEDLRLGRVVAFSHAFADLGR